MTAAPQPNDNTEQADVYFNVAEQTFVADVSGALWWPETETLIVADLHLEKGSAYARRGAFLPPYDSRTTLRRLEATMQRRAPKRMILLGDSFHDLDAMHRLPKAEREHVCRLQAQCAWIWITGNHDPAISERLGGDVCEDYAEAGLTLRHEPGPLETTGEIAGHLHPAARIVRHGRSLRRKCFIANDTRVVIPAFGAYTGGLNVCDEAFTKIFLTPGTQNGPRVWMVGENGVYSVAAKDLRGD